VGDDLLQGGFERPWTSTFTGRRELPRRRIWQMVPAGRNASEPAAHRRSRPAGRRRHDPGSDLRACSTALSEISRETKSGTTHGGNTTRRARQQRSTSGTSSSRSTAVYGPRHGGTLPLREARSRSSSPLRPIGPPGNGQAGEETPSVSPARDARSRRATMPRSCAERISLPKPCFRPGRPRHLVGGERILADGAQLLDARLHQRLARRGEGQLGR